MCVTIPLGVTAMCFGMVFTSINALFINTYYTGKLINVGYLTQMKDLLPILFISLLMGACAYASTWLFSTEWIKLFMAVVIGGIMYLILSIFFAKDEYIEVMNVIKKK